MFNIEGQFVTGHQRTPELAGAPVAEGVLVSKMIDAIRISGADAGSIRRGSAPIAMRCVEIERKPAMFFADCDKDINLEMIFIVTSEFIASKQMVTGSGRT